MKVAYPESTIAVVRFNPQQKRGGRYAVSKGTVVSIQEPSSPRDRAAGDEESLQFRSKLVPL